MQNQKLATPCRGQAFQKQALACRHWKIGRDFILHAISSSGKERFNHKECAPKILDKDRRSDFLFLIFEFRVETVRSLRLSAVNCTWASNFANGGPGGPGGASQPDANGGLGGDGGGGEGGGIENFNTLNLASCTFSLNNAQGGSGRIGGPGAGTGVNGASGALGIAQGGGVRSTTTLNSIQNSLFAANTSSAGPNCSGAFTSQGYNLVAIVNGASGFTGPGDQTGTSGSPLNAQLGAFFSNGVLPPAIALLPASPAVDKGKSGGLLTDQWGRPRPFDFPSIPSAPGGDGSDIGAFELTAPSLTLSRSGSVVVLAWPANEPGFILESASELTSAPAWSAVPGTPAMVDNQYRMTNTLTGTLFYRLKSP